MLSSTLLARIFVALLKGLPSEGDNSEPEASAAARAQNVAGNGKGGKAFKSNSEGGGVMQLPRSLFTQMKISEEEGNRREC